jgi:signal transduction histidine kinase/CheY-like chemotaxis protein/predicted DsbA family dithiol-disulfide isomerase
VSRINRIYADINCPFCFVLNEWLHEKGLEDTIDWIGIEHEPFLTKDIALTSAYSKQYKQEVSSCLLRSEGILLSPPEIRYPSKLALMLLEQVRKEDRNNFNKVKRAIYRAMWKDSLDISSLEILKEITSKITSIDLAQIEKYEDTVNENTKLWEDLGYDRIPMSLSNTGAKYLGLGSKSDLEVFLKSGIISEVSNDACFSNNLDEIENLNSPLVNSILNYTLEPIFILNEEDQIVLCNNSATSLCNKKNHIELYGNKISQFLTGFPDSIQRNQIVFSTTNQFNVKHWEIWTNRFQEKDSVYKVLSWRDITELKEQNKSLKEKNEKLNQQDRDKDQFMAMISHELRTPLNCIIGFIDLLKESKLDEEQSDILERVSKSGNDLLILVNDFLEFSKIKNGELQFEYSPANLNNEVSKVIEATSILTQENNCKIKFKKIDENLANVKVDSLRLGQILYNLIGNAIKFTKNDDIEIAIDVNEESHYIFSIKDNGIGIPKENQDTIFNPFVQGGKDISRKFGGTGLGLTVSKGLVENFGGRIWLESEENKGTTFFFNIPLDQISESEIDDSQQPHLVKDLLMSKEYPLEVLLVEDNKTNQLLFKRFIGKLGYIPDIAVDGLQAVEMVKKKKYNIVFMDLYMPNLDGIDATKEIRREFSKEELPICALTANDIKSIKDECFEVGMNDFITKPVSLNDIKKVILSYLTKI